MTYAYGNIWRRKKIIMIPYSCRTSFYYYYFSFAATYLLLLLIRYHVDVCLSMFVSVDVNAVFFFSFLVMMIVNAKEHAFLLLSSSWVSLLFEIATCGCIAVMSRCAHYFSHFFFSFFVAPSSFERRGSASEDSGSYSWPSSSSLPSSTHPLPRKNSIRSSSLSSVIRVLKRNLRRTETKKKAERWGRNLWEVKYYPLFHSFFFLLENRSLGSRCT